MASVVALGELLIDFVSTVTGASLADAPAFQKAAGGAPANVAAGVAKLGHSAAFLGKVGDDPFGHYLARALGAAGVDTSGLRYDTEARTGLAFVSLHADGEREFIFFRNPSADMRYRPDEVDEALIRGATILHIGSILLASADSRAATYHAVAVAEGNGLLISFDPNLRPALWPSVDEARKEIMAMWPRASLIKVSEEELQILSGTSSLDEGASILWHPKLRLLAVTRGAAGVRYFMLHHAGDVPAFPVAAVDTTGAGDAFVAGLLVGLLRDPDALADPDHLFALCRYANAVGALTTTQRGAIPALPDAATVERFIADTN